MRIALLSSQWPGVRLGGIGVYTRHCAGALAAAGHEVHVFTLPLPADARPVDVGYIIHELDEAALPRQFPRALPMGDQLKFRMALQAAFADAVAAVHARMPLDIIEAPEYEAPAKLLIERQLAPVVTHLHSGTAIIRDLAAQTGQGAAIDQEHALLEALELEVIAGGDGLCAPSSAVARDTEAAYQLPDLAAHAQVIPLPFPLSERPFAAPAPGAPLLFVGRLEQLKGVHLLAEAAVTFLRQNPTATVHIAGPDTLDAPVEHAAGAGSSASGGAGGGGSGRAGGSMTAWMQRRLAEFGLRVRFLGERSAAQVASDMQDAAAVVIPSLRESYSYVCCEALAAGRAVIVSTDIGATEVAGDAGLTFPRGNAAALAVAMERLWRDAELRERLCRTAWSRARETLAPARTVGQRVAFYERVIALRNGGGAEGGGRAEGREDRYFCLPQSHSFRVLVAQALADGDAELVQAFGKQAELPAATLTAGDRLMARLSDLPHPARFYLYGAGRHTARLLLDKHRWEALGHRLVGLIDDHPRYQTEPQAHGLAVISCATAAQTLAADDVVALSTDAFEEQFWNNTAPLRARQITVLRLYTTTP